jgi:glycerol-3-phosphate dehydrogenase
MACRKLGKPGLVCRTRTQRLESSNTQIADVDTLNDEDFKKYCRNKIESSMVTHLTDLVLRRMNLAMRGKLTQNRLKICVDVMAQAFEWTTKQQLKEIEDLNKTWLSPSLKQDLNRIICTFKS